MSSGGIVTVLPRNQNAPTQIGHIILLDEYYPPSPTFPYMYVSAPSQAIDVANWPNYVPWLRNKPVRHDAGFSNAIDFSTTDYAIVSNVATLTLPSNPSSRTGNFVNGSAVVTGLSVSTADLAPGMILQRTTSDFDWPGNGYVIDSVDSSSQVTLRTPFTGTSNSYTVQPWNKEMTMLYALWHEQAVHGSFANWFPITISTPIGPIAADDYAITGISLISRTISFSYTHIDDSASVAGSIRIYKHRIPGQTSKAQIYTAAGRGFVMNHTNDPESMPGFRRPSRVGFHDHGPHSHTHYYSADSVPGGSLGSPFPGPYGPYPRTTAVQHAGAILDYYNVMADTTKAIALNGMLEKIVEGPSETVYAYRWGVTYVP